MIIFNQSGGVQMKTQKLKDEIVNELSKLEKLKFNPIYQTIVSELNEWGLDEAKNMYEVRTRATYCAGFLQGLTINDYTLNFLNGNVAENS
jgi:hypothetical protein